MTTDIRSPETKTPGPSEQLQPGVVARHGAWLQKNGCLQREANGRPASPGYTAARGALANCFRLAVLGWGSLGLQWGGSGFKFWVTISVAPRLEDSEPRWGVGKCLYVGHMEEAAVCGGEGEVVVGWFLRHSRGLKRVGSSRGHYVRLLRGECWRRGRGSEMV